MSRIITLIAIRDGQKTFNWHHPPRRRPYIYSENASQSGLAAALTNWKKLRRQSQIIAFGLLVVPSTQIEPGGSPCARGV